MGLEGIDDLLSKTLRAGVKKMKKIHSRTEVIKDGRRGLKMAHSRMEMTGNECRRSEVSTPGNEDAWKEMVTMRKCK